MLKQFVAGLALSLFAMAVQATDVCPERHDRHGSISANEDDIKRCIMYIHEGIKEKQVSVEFMGGRLWSYQIVFSASTYYGHMTSGIPPRLPAQ